MTVGSDWNTDWVQTPEGQKFTLGRISVAKFLGALCDQSRLRSALDQFLNSGETMVNVDLNQMWEMLKPVRARYGVASPFMTSPSREGRNPMHDFKAFEASLSQAEKALTLLTQKVASKQAQGIASARQAFVVAANKIKSPNQSKNQTYYGYGDPPVFEVGDAPPPVEAAPTAKAAGNKLAYDVLQENSTIAGEILANLEETNEKIDSLVQAGKKFNAAKAKADLHGVSTKVAGILRDVDLAQSWVRGDLDKLAAHADQLHGVFFPKS